MDKALSVLTSALHFTAGRPLDLALLGGGILVVAAGGTLVYRRWGRGAH